MIVKAGSTDVTTYFVIRNTSDGEGKTGISIPDLDIQYVRSGAAPVAAVSLVALALTSTAHTDNRGIEIDATDQPGLYRVDWPDAAFATGVREVILSVRDTETAPNNAFVEHLRVELSPEVDVSHWNGAAVATPQVSGMPDVTLADDANHGGTTAVITAERIVVASTTAGQPGIKATGNTTGSGILATGGASGHGLEAQGGASNGHGMEVTSNAAGNAGILTTGNTTGPGLQCNGGTTGTGIEGRGGATSGPGILANAQAGNDNGLECAAHGTGEDIAGTLEALKGHTPQTADLGGLILTTGTATGGTISTVIDTSRTDADDYWNGQLIVMTSGAAAGQSAVIRDYNGTTDTFTISPQFGSAVGSSDTYVVFNGLAVKAGFIPLVRSQMQGLGGGATGREFVDVEAMSGVNVIGSAQIATNAIGSTEIAANAIGASQLATDAIGAAQLAADALAEIADDVWDEVLTGGTHNVASSAGKRLRELQENEGYEDGAIWVDTVNGTAGTEDFVNGTVTNPVASIADANTLSASLNLHRFRIVSGSTITFAASQAGDVFLGTSWTLALGGQNVAGIYVGGATVSGIMGGTGTTQIFQQCLMGTCSLIAGTHVLESSLGNGHTVVEAGDYFYDRCHSAMAGLGTPSFNFGAAIGNTNLNVRNYSGGIQLEAMGDTGTDSASIEGNGQVIEGTCTGGTVAIRGNFTVSGITNLTLSDDARYDITQVNDQVVDVLRTDTLTELGVASPSASPTFEDAIMLLYMAIRNANTATATARAVKNDAGTQIASAVMSDNGTTFDQGKLV